MDRLRKATTSRWARWAAGLILMGGWVWLLLPSGLGGPLSLVWVRGESMEPTYYGGDLAVVYRLGSYEPGDIVAFAIPEGGIVIHRIIEETKSGNFIFQGDNRSRPDPWELTSSEVVGQALLRIPAGGRVLAVLRQPFVLGALAFAIVLLVGLPSLKSEKPLAPSDPTQDHLNLVDEAGIDGLTEVDSLR